MFNFLKKFKAIDLIIKDVIVDWMVHVKNTSRDDLM